MPTCFVIQPFDGDMFDKRYRDTFQPGIEAAALEPYRVDHDPATTVPIESIESGIRNAAVCFAEISTDNPNVWFELGYAISAQKPVVMVCSDARKTPFPFDIQHRTIIKYKTHAPSDFKALQEDITSRLQAALKKQVELDRVSALAPLADVQGLSPHEMMALVVVAENCDTPDGYVPPHQLRIDMERLGYTRIGIKMAVEKLLKKGMISTTDVPSDSFNESFKAYTLEPRGFEWLERNEHRLVLRRDEDRKEAITDLTDDDIPF